LAGGMNTYAYALGNPVMFTDPLGLCACGLPSSSNFMSNYPDYSYSGKDVWKLIGGSLNDNYGENSPGGTQNSCAARVSHGLNESGAKIPNSPQHQTNKNWGGNNNRYIISASHMNSYLRSAYGAPSQTLTSSSQLSSLRSGLASGQSAIVSSNWHVAVVTSTYADSSVSSSLGDVWILPTGACSCN
jgi:hypothetical protein